MGPFFAHASLCQLRRATKGSLRSEAEEVVGEWGGGGGEAGAAAVLGAGALLGDGDVTEGDEAAGGEGVEAVAYGGLGEVEAAAALADADDLGGVLEDVAQDDEAGGGEAVAVCAEAVPGGEDAEGGAHVGKDEG